MAVWACGRGRVRVGCSGQWSSGLQPTARTQVVAWWLSRHCGPWVRDLGFCCFCTAFAPARPLGARGEAEAEVAVTTGLSGTEGLKQSNGD